MVNVALPGAAVGSPVFVLCGARSGSTLLRFMLDAHPALACPPETNIPSLCGQLATVWSLIEGAPLSSERGGEPPVVPDPAINGIRQTVDQIIGSYLARRGARRFCDKSLSTARFTDLLIRVYPEARFLCLHRHPMDMIASGIEACPWGLRNYGFDSYIAASPGNTVVALARYWNDNTSAILAAEETFSGACHRVRYEDLVTDPEGAMADVFAFLGLPPLPGIAGRCFATERERTGPADYKIWHTSAVSTRSIGRGWSLPSGQIAAPVLEQLNELAERLGYLQVGGDWGTTPMPADMRADSAGPAAPQDPAPRDAAPDADDLVGQRLGTELARLAAGFDLRWGELATVPFGIVITGTGADTNPVRWRVCLAARTAIRLAEGDDDGTEWDVLGSAAAWDAVLSGDVNFGVALRRHELRYCDTGEGGPPFPAETRVDMLGDFLGLASWRPTPEPAQTSDVGRELIGIRQGEC
jgi:hypothetical protein